VHSHMSAWGPQLARGQRAAWALYIYGHRAARLYSWQGSTNYLYCQTTDFLVLSIPSPLSISSQVNPMHGAWQPRLHCNPSAQPSPKPCLHPLFPFLHLPYSHQHPVPPPSLYCSVASSLCSVDVSRAQRRLSPCRHAVMPQAVSSARAPICAVCCRPFLGLAASGVAGWLYMCNWL
jgi:hypothetical protein